MNRTDILDKAKDCVTGQREQDANQPENNFKMIAELWTEYLGHEITPVDVTMMMCLLKIARIKTGHDMEDSFVDICGYSSFGGELANEKSNSD